MMHLKLPNIYIFYYLSFETSHFQSGGKSKEESKENTGTKYPISRDT